MSYGAGEVKELPDWLSQLQRLEYLDLSSTNVATPQPALARLPLLRWVVLRPAVDAAVVLSHAPHLCWYGKLRYT
jgi:hypothetical protein